MNDSKMGEYLSISHAIALIANVPKDQIKAWLAGSCDDWGHCSVRQSVDSPSTDIPFVCYSFVVIRCTVKSSKQSMCKLIKALFTADI